MIRALYIHIPFCESICNYCDFSKVLKGYYSEDEYIDALICEIQQYKIEDDSLKTIYIGGGTPTCLSIEPLRRLLSYLHERQRRVVEFTLEANPESATSKKLLIAKDCGVNRISLGVEASDDKRLKYLGRRHSLSDAKKAIERIKNAGFENISLDFIYGLEGESLADIRRDLEFALDANVPHLSFYSLQVEEGTIFGNRKVKTDDDLAAAEYQLIKNTLESCGFKRYEVSSFSKPGYQSLHNLTYWRDEMYYAAGLSASGYIASKRYTNTRSLSKYLAHDFHYKEEEITEKESEFEYLMLNLRLEDGFLIEDFNRRFKRDFLVDYKEEIAKVKDRLVIKNGRFSIASSYIYTMDSILLELLKEY